MAPARQRFTRMTLRRQILLTAWAAGGVFTLMLAWMAYFTQPFTMPHWSTIAMATAVVGLYWMLIALQVARVIETRIDATVEAMKKRMEETFHLRKRVAGQQIMLSDFTRTTLPVTETLASHAGRIADQSAKLARSKTPTTITSRLLESSDALHNEIRTLLDETRTLHSQADLLRLDLAALSTLQPLLEVQMQELESVARRFSILALNAAIEHARGPHGGDRIFVREVRQLSSYAETIAGALQEQLARLRESAGRAATIANPLADHARTALANSEALDQLASEQWREIMNIHHHTETTSNEAGLATLRFTLVESANTVADQCGKLKRSVEELAKKLPPASEAA